MDFKELTSKFDEFKDQFKSLSKMIDRLVNSSQTPEEFLLLQEMPPSLAKIDNFLRNYDLRQVINVQMFDSKNRLFYSGNTVGFCLSLPYASVNREMLLDLFNHKYPKGSTMSILLSKVGAPVVYLTITQSSVKNKNAPTKVEQLLSVRQRILNSLNKYGIDTEIMLPRDILDIINQMLANSPENAEYKPDSYINEQLSQSHNNSITKDGRLQIGKSNLIVYYSKQYPNLGSSNIDSPIGLFMNALESKTLDFYYCINVNLNCNKQDKEPLYAFTSTLVSLNSEFDLGNFFRYQYNWFIYPNIIYPFQQFIETIPFQYNLDAAVRQHRYSTTQMFPTCKLIELLPLESKS